MALDESRYGAGSPVQGHTETWAEAEEEKDLIGMSDKEAIMADETLPERSCRRSLIRAAIYARVSTANNGQDPSMQTREIREYCERRGWQLVGEYVDLGS